jgi:hypothetical protein
MARLHVGTLLLKRFWWSFDWPACPFFQGQGQKKSMIGEAYLELHSYSYNLRVCWAKFMLRINSLATSITRFDRSKPEILLFVARGFFLSTNFSTFTFPN